MLRGMVCEGRALNSHSNLLINMKIGKIFCAVALLLLAASCKPTEKNYQAAYEAARNKRTAEAAPDPDMALPAGGAFQRLDAPQTKDVNGEKLRIKHFYIKYIGSGESPALGKYNVAVARYKMPTNVKAQAEDLVSAGYKAFPVEGADGFYYVIAAAFPSLEETAEFVGNYKKTHEPSQFVGLDDDLLIIEH